MSDRSKRFSTIGKPRSITDAQIAEILAWNATRRTNIQKAQELGITVNVLSYVIRTNGKGYKQPSPELRSQYLVHDRTRRDRLRRAYLL